MRELAPRLVSSINSPFAHKPIGVEALMTLISGTSERRRRRFGDTQRGRLLSVDSIDSTGESMLTSNGYEIMRGTARVLRERTAPTSIMRASGMSDRERGIKKKKRRENENTV